jgi:16S rRNA G527 N7-methylase RsmG
LDIYYPEWTSGLLSQNKKDKLVSYNQWLLTEGIKKGLISNKPKDYVWEEFVIHSLGFGLIINTEYK